MDDARIVEYIGITQAALKKASGDLAAQKQASAGVAKLAEDATDALISAGLIEPRQRQRGHAQLAKHAEALTLIVKLAGKYSEKPPEAIGKVAAASDARGPARAADGVPESTRRFVETMLAVRNR